MKILIQALALLASSYGHAASSDVKFEFVNVGIDIESEIKDHCGNYEYRVTRVFAVEEGVALISGFCTGKSEGKPWERFKKAAK